MNENHNTRELLELDKPSVIIPFMRIGSTGIPGSSRNTRNLEGIWEMMKLIILTSQVNILTYNLMTDD